MYLAHSRHPINPCWVNGCRRWGEIYRSGFSWMLMHRNLSHIRERCFTRVAGPRAAKNQKVENAFWIPCAVSAFFMGSKKAALTGHCHFNRPFLFTGNYPNISSTETQRIASFCHMGCKPSVYQVSWSAQEDPVAQLQLLCKNRKWFLFGFQIIISHALVLLL